ncbi:MAG: hypothetical protein K5931_01955, partial [Lachnospiraceae bacterium]|nr:hypothetical protein [Lachnospiraceae bacterium]
MKKKKLMGQRLAAIVLCCAMTFSQSMPVYGLQTEAVKADSENSVSQGNVENSNEMMLESDMEGSEDGSYLVDLDSTSETGSVLDNDQLDDRVKNIELETVAEKQAEVEASREFANESKSLVDFVNELDSKRDSLDSAEILTSEEVSATESQGIENVGDDT